MSRKTIAIEDATREQLMAYAEREMGRRPPDNIGIEKLRERIRVGSDGEAIDVDEGSHRQSDAYELDGQDIPLHDLRPPETPDEVIFRPDTAIYDPVYFVELAETELPGGKQPVPVGVNGRTKWYERNKIVAMPHRHFLALQNARGTRFEQEDARPGERAGMREVSYATVPMSVSQRPSRAMIDAWNEASDAYDEKKRRQVEKKTEERAARALGRLAQTEAA